MSADTEPPLEWELPPLPDTIARPDNRRHARSGPTDRLRARAGEPPPTAYRPSGLTVTTIEFAETGDGSALTWTEPSTCNGVGGPGVRRTC